MRAVTFTDIVQLFMFTSILPLLGLAIWDTLDPSCTMASTLAVQPQLNLPQFMSSPTQIISAIALMIYYVIPGFTPSTFQRISMARDVHQVKKSFTYAAIFYCIITVCLIWVAILLLTDSTQLGITKNNLIAHLMQRYTTVGFKGLLAIGIMAMVMSTADSSINAGAVVATNDLVQPYLKPKNPLLLTRLFAVLIGSLGLLLTFCIQDLLQLILLTGSLYMPIITVPFLLAIFGFRSTTRPVLIGMGAGFMVVCLFLVVLGPQKYGEIRLASGMLANMLTFIGSHYLLKSPGGWVGIKDKTLLLAARQHRQRARIRRQQQWKNFRLYPYLQSLLPKQAIDYILFGIYILGIIYLSLYYLPPTFKTAYPAFYKFIRYAMVLLASSFITYPIWPPRLNTKAYITIAWPIGHFILCLASSILAFLCEFDALHAFILIFNLMIVSMLLHWYLGLAMTLICIPISYIVQKLYLPLSYSAVVGTPIDIQLLFLLILLSSMLMFYFKHKYEQNKLRRLQNNYLQNKYRYITEKCYKAEMHQACFYKELDVDTVQENLKKIKQKLQKAGESTENKLLQQTTKELDALANYFEQVIYVTKDHLTLQIENIDINTLWQDILQALKYSDIGLQSNITIQAGCQKTG